MGGGRWGWAAALAIAAGASGCDEGGAPVRGFHSRQLVSTRDPTLSLVGFGSKIVTDGDRQRPELASRHRSRHRPLRDGTSAARTYWRSEPDRRHGDGAGATDTARPQPPGPPERFDCRYEGIGTTGVYTLFVVDAETGQDIASIDRVVGSVGCPRYPDRYLAIVRLDENDVGRLWTGPFDGLVRAELDLAIDRPLRGNWSYEPDPTKWRMTVLAAAGPAPAGRGIYDIDLAQLTTGEVIPPALADVTWAPGAAPSGSVRSDGLALADVAIVYGSGGARRVPLPPADERRQRGHVRRTAGPRPRHASWRCFRWPAKPRASSWRTEPAPESGQTSSPGSKWVRPVRTPTCLLNWDTANQRIISCPFARGTLPAGVHSRDAPA